MTKEHDSSKGWFSEISDGKNFDDWYRQTIAITVAKNIHHCITNPEQRDIFEYVWSAGN